MRFTNDRRHLYVMAEPCGRCLFGPHPIVSAERVAEVIDICHREGKHFSCHESTAADADAVCAGFMARWPLHTPAMRLAAAHPDRLLRMVR